MAQLLAGTRVFGNTSIDSILIVGNVTSYAATSNATGSLVVTGGVGVTGNIYAGNVYVGNVNTVAMNTSTANINALVASTSNATGSLKVAGGVGILGNLYAGNVYVVNTYASTSNTTGSLVLLGGGGIATTGNIYSGNISITGSTANGLTFPDASVLRSANTTATMQIMGGANGTYYATAYAQKALTIRYLATTAIGANQANITVYIANSAQNVGGLTNVIANSATAGYFPATGNNIVSLGQTITVVVANSTINGANSIVLTLGMV